MNRSVVEVVVGNLLDQIQESVMVEGSRGVFNHDVDCVVDFIVVLVKIHCLIPATETYGAHQAILCKIKRG